MMKKWLGIMTARDRNAHDGSRLRVPTQKILRKKIKRKKTDEMQNKNMKKRVTLSFIYGDNLH